MAAQIPGDRNSSYGHTQAAHYHWTEVNIVRRNRNRHSSPCNTFEGIHVLLTRGGDVFFLAEKGKCRGLEQFDSIRYKGSETVSNTTCGLAVWAA